MSECVCVCVCVCGGGYSLFTEAVQHSPVGIRHCKPLTCARSNVNVQGTEIVVLLVA